MNKPGDIVCVRGQAESVVCACVIVWVCARVVVLLRHRWYVGVCINFVASTCVHAADVSLFGEFMVN
jgi:hypothetical protein